MLNDEDEAVKPSLLSLSRVGMSKRRAKTQGREARKPSRSAPNPKYRSVERVQVRFALIIEEAAVRAAAHTHP